jgi:integrase
MPLPTQFNLEIYMEMMMQSLDAYLAEHAGTRVNGNKASIETATRHGEALRAAARRLHARGYKLTDLSNVGDRHIKALCEDYVARGLAPKTIAGYLSHLKIFCERNGKKGLVKTVFHYLPDVPKEKVKVSTIAKKSKSWHEAGINVQEKILEAEAIDPRFGVILLMQVAFGLRRKEALQLKPWVVDHDDKVAATKTKNGRPRSIYIDTPEQRWALDRAKAITKGKNDTLGWKERQDNRPFRGKDIAHASYSYSKNHYNYLMRKIGITKQDAACTGHGLRAQYAENSALLRGLIPPTLGGSGGQMDKDDRDVIRLQVSEALGHSRLSVTGAYYGSFGRNNDPDAPSAIKREIEAALDAISPEQLKSVPSERNIDCASLSVELSEIQVFTDLRRIQFLWENHSRRNAVDWVSLGKDSNLAALKAAATSVLKGSRGNA